MFESGVVDQEKLLLFSDIFGLPEFSSKRRSLGERR